MALANQALILEAQSGATDQAMRRAVRALRL
jgi:hypothetical protein